MLHGRAMRAGFLVCAGLVLAACAGSDSAGEGGSTAAEPGGVLVPLQPASAEPEQDGPAPDEPVTHLGRAVLRRCDLVARARVVALSEPLPGTELARLETRELIAGLAPDGDLRVLCGERGKLPRVGEEGIFFLQVRPRSLSLTLVDVSPLSDRAAEMRLAALRDYVRIEMRPTRDARVGALLTYLRRAARSPERWTRDNAAREYSALAAWDPSVLGPEDAIVLRSARSRVRDPETRRLLDRALSMVDSSSAPRAGHLASRAAATTRKQEDPSLFERRYAAPGVSAEARRAAVVDAATAVGAAAKALFERALEDEAAVVREAAVVAAARAGVLEPAVAHLLATEPVPTVRRSIVRALGLLASERSIPSLGALAGNAGPLGREACFALARIRTPDAVERLRALQRDTTDAARGDLLDFLLSDAFLEQERRLGER